MDIARETALKILYKIDEEKAYSNIVLNSEIKKQKEKLQRKDIGLISEIVYGVTTWRITLDEIIEKYSKISRQIYILKNKEEPDEEELQRLYDRRANIGKNAMNKMPALEDLFERMNPQTIKDTILFVSDKQIESSFAIMSKKGIKRSKITEAESASKVVNIAGDTERQNIISQFVKQQLQVLVGIKCLDEGIDIPNARIAILLSNSTNPREYVQRVGRVIRQAPNKQVSIIYDFIVTPVGGNADGSGILEKEARRADQIAQNAENYEDVKMKFLQRGVQIDADK